MNEPAPPLVSFLTDASIVAVADSLALLGGVALTLRDHNGHRIVRTESDPPWAVCPPDMLSLSVATALRERRPAAVVGSALYPLFPLNVRDVPAGAFVVESPGWGAVGPIQGAIGRCLTHLSTVIEEFCAREVGLNERNEELALLYRLLSALTASRDAPAAADAALRLAVDYFEARGGTIHLLGPAGRWLELVAHQALPPQSAQHIAAIPYDREQAPTLGEAGAQSVREVAAALGFGDAVTTELRFSGRPFGVLRLFFASEGVFDPTDRELLQTIAEQAADAIGRIKLAAADRHARRQFKLAADVQQRMLPGALPPTRRCDIAARCESSLDVGGDFYDVFQRDGSIAMAVADVVGKGVPAGLMMASIRASLRAYATQPIGVHDVVRKVNRAMARDTLSNEFATLIFADLDESDLTLTYCNAGHDPPILARRAGDRYELELLEAGGMVVGVDAEQVYESGTLSLRAGDVLVTCTDGVVEAMDFDGRKFGRDRLLASLSAFLSDYPSAPAGVIVDHIIWEVRRFAGLAPQSDDTTVLVVRVTDG